MKRLIVYLILFLTYKSYSQHPKLYISLSYTDETDCRQIYIYNSVDTFFRGTADSTLGSHSIAIDSILPGKYTLHIFSCKKPDEFIITREFEIVADSQTVIRINAYIDESHSSNFVDPKASKFEMRFSFSYARKDHSANPEWMQFGINFVEGASYYKPITKHIGVLEGINLGYGYYRFSGDTAFINRLPYVKKIKDRYEYLNLQFDSRIRISSGSQQQTPLHHAGWFIDIGIIYYLPLALTYKARYEDDIVLRKYSFHRFKDLRAVAEFGYSYITVFGEYRLFDFMKRNFAELPKYRFGLAIHVY